MHQVHAAEMVLRYLFTCHFSKPGSCLVSKSSSKPRHMGTCLLNKAPVLYQAKLRARFNSGWSCLNSSSTRLVPVGIQIKINATVQHFSIPSIVKTCREKQQTARKPYEWFKVGNVKLKMQCLRPADVANARMHGRANHSGW